MAINFEEIPSEVELPIGPPPVRPTVLDEINARKALVEEREVKCKDIKPLYRKVKKTPPRYLYRYFCVCPHYHPQYRCKHSGNIIIDRDVLTPEEHLVFLATPKINLAAPRKMPRFYQKRLVMPSCTAHIDKLAQPDLARVKENIQKYQHIIRKRGLYSLKQLTKKKPKIEYTDINTALAWIDEERRLKRVAKRLNKQRCQKLNKKIRRTQRNQIKKIICVLFEEMKDFLLNDQFVMDERSTLVGVILETIREFTDKEFYTTSNLREYQKILAFNLAVWINKFISNLNIHIAPGQSQMQQQQQPIEDYGEKLRERPTLDLQTHLPIDDYISCSLEHEEEEEMYASTKMTTLASEEGEGEGEVEFSYETEQQ